MIFYIIFCSHVELINFPLLKRPSEGHSGRNFDVADINQNKNGIVRFTFMFHLKCNSREVEYHIMCQEVCSRKQFTNNLFGRQGDNLKRYL